MEPKRVFFGRLLSFVIFFNVVFLNSAATYAAPSNGPLRTQSQDFLNSLYEEAYIYLPRLHSVAGHIFIAHPSLLQQWGWINSDGIAHYNPLTNTLITPPDNTIYDSSLDRRRLRTLRELHDEYGSAARVSAGVLIHELSHAEWDIYIEEGVTSVERDLLAVLDEEIPKIAKATHLSFFYARLLASEIFAYYREELISTILSDYAEIKYASGMEPETNVCMKLRKPIAALRDFSPNDKPYFDRVSLWGIFVRGTEVDLNLAPLAKERVKAALDAYMQATALLPSSRADLFHRLENDSKVQKALARCQAFNTHP